MGQAAPAMSVKTLAGEEITSSLADGEILLVNFASTSCIPCRQELPHLEDIWATYKDNDKFQAVVILPHDNQEELEEFCRKVEITFPIACDKAGQKSYQKIPKAVPGVFYLLYNCNAAAKSCRSLKRRTAEDAEFLQQHFVRTLRASAF